MKPQVKAVPDINLAAIELLRQGWTDGEIIGICKGKISDETLRQIKAEARRIKRVTYSRALGF